MKTYTFASHEKESEYERLCLIQDSFDEKSQRHLLKAGLKRGMDCLEVGVGAGSLASWMQKEVGEEGSVLGVDLNTGFVKGTPGYDLLEGDILELDLKCSFDFIHLRYVLIHNNNAKDILKKLFGLLRAGGKLIVEEPDFSLAKWMDAKELDACKRVNSAVCKMFENRGLKAYYGSIAHLSLEEIGFEIEENKSYLHLCSGNEDVAKVMASSARALSEAYLETGLCSTEDIVAYTQACESSESLAVYYATIALSAYKRDEVFNDEEVREETTRRKDGVYMVREDTDILMCFELMNELRIGLKKEEFVAQIREQMQGGYCLFCMYEDSLPVALAGCKIGTNLAWGRYLYVEDLVTQKGQRSLGCGSEILDYLINFAKEKGCTQIHLDSGVQRFEAHKFYLREGFKIASHHFSRSLS